MYQALYRKYRSRTFDELMGQEAIISALKNQVKSGEISHAYLFSGTRGTGKTSAAKILSRAVNCLDPQDGNPCNQCAACLGILSDTIMDVVEMDAASNNGVDDIRELKEKVIYPPTSVKYKVYIIDEVHMLSKGAFNALLKILEEPPKHLIFILATTEPEKIPQTILSRTQKFNFKRMSIETIIENLKFIAKEEGKSCEEEVYQLIAKNSDGAMRDALSLFDQLMSYSQEHISYEMAVEVLGISSYELLFSLSKHLLDQDVNGSISDLHQIAAQGKDYMTLNRDLLKHFRDLMLLMTLENPENFVITSHMDEFTEQQKGTDLSRVFTIIDILKEMQRNIRYVDDPKILFEMNVLRICRGASMGNLEERVARLEQLADGQASFTLSSSDEVKDQSSALPANSMGISLREQRSEKNKKIKNLPIENRGSFDRDEATVVTESRKLEDMPISSLEEIENEENSDIMSKGSPTLAQIESDWASILNDMKAMRRINVAALLKEARPLEIKNGILEIGFAEKFEFHLRAVSTEENLKFISHILKERYDAELEIRVVIIREEPMKKLYDLFGKENIEEI